LFVDFPVNTKKMCLPEVGISVTVVYNNWYRTYSM
jgi:hypothetical protein